MFANVLYHSKDKLVQMSDVVNEDTLVEIVT